MRFSQLTVTRLTRTRRKVRPRSPLNSHRHHANLRLLAATKHRRTLLDFIDTNSEVRKLLSDFSVLGRDVLARGDEHAAGMLRPDQVRLQQVYQAPAVHFVTQGSRAVGPGETPVAEAFNPGVNGVVRHHPDGSVHIEKDGQKHSVKEAKQTAVQRGQQATNPTVDEAQRTKAYVLFPAF